jgi:hypothetical protein
MQQRSIVADFALKGLSVPKVQNDLEATLERDAVAYISITHYLHKARFPPSSADPLRSTLHGASTIPIEPSYSLSEIVHLCQCISYLDSLTPLRRPSIPASRNRVDLVRVSLNGCHML